jgi:hypothetical protein
MFFFFIIIEIITAELILQVFFSEIFSCIKLSSKKSFVYLNLFTSNFLNDCLWIEIMKVERQKKKINRTKA